MVSSNGRKTVCAVAAAIAVVLGASRAFAPGGPTRICMVSDDVPCLDAVPHEVSTWRDGDSVEWALFADFGIVTSQNPTRYLCRKAYGDRTEWVDADDERWLVAEQRISDEKSRLLRSENQCSFREERTFRKQTNGAWWPVLDGAVVDWAVQSNSERIAYVSRIGEERGQEIFVSDDGGATFEPISIDVENRVFTGIAWNGGDELIVSALRHRPRDDSDRVIETVFFRTDAPEDVAAVPGARLGIVEAASGDQIVWQRHHWDKPDDARIRVGDAPSRSSSVVGGTLEEPVQASFRFQGRRVDAVFGSEGKNAWATPRTADDTQLLRGTVEDDSFEWSEVETDVETTCIDRTGAYVYICGTGEGRSHHLYRRPVDGSGSLEGVYSFDRLEGYRAGCSDDGDDESCASDWSDVQTAVEDQSE